jgi:hypothetical protein
MRSPNPGLARLLSYDDLAQNAIACGRPLTTLDIPGFKICEAFYDAAIIVPSQTRPNEN